MLHKDMTGIISFFEKEKHADWKDLDTNRFFYNTQEQAETPGSGSEVG